MKDLIEALTILSKYTDNEYPTNCSHDWLGVCHIEEGAVSAEDAARLEQLGFLWDDEYECWGSFRFGSC
jgi:hypothetical protein